MILNIQPTKRVLIAGSRNFDDYNTAKEYIDLCLFNIRKKYRITIVSGGAIGTDQLGERYAHENKMKCEYYYPDWKRFGKGAGPKRNLEMVKNSDFVICFWDKSSKGTKSTIEFAKKLQKPIRIKYINRQ